MKLKRKLKKLFFYDRSFIKMVCFLIVLLLVLILGNTFGFVSADEVSSENLWLNMEAYEDSENYDANNANVAYIRPQNSIAESNAILGSNAVLNHTYSFNGAETPSSFNMNDVQYYVITGDILSSTWRIYMFTTPDCHIYMDGSSHQFVVDTGKNPSKFYVADIQSYSDGTNLVSPYAVFPDSCAANDTIYYTVGNFEMYYTRVSMSNSSYILASNMDILTYQGSLVQPTILYEYINWLDGGTANNIVNVNYLYGNAHGLGGFDNLTGIGDGLPGGGETNETSENNMYLQDSKWNFSIPAWNKLTSYSGNATFSASLNDFQQENLNDFYLRFTFAIYTTQSYVDISYGGGGTSGGDHDIDVLGSGSQYTGYKNYIFKYLDSSSNNQYIDVTLQDFYNMGSSKAFMTLNGIFDRCYKVGFSGNMSDTKFIDWYNEAIVSSSNTTTKATLYCYATLYDSSGNSSGNCTYYYDLLNGTSGVTDSSMSVNNNPYVDEDGDISTTIPEEGTTESTYNGNGVNVTQNVTVNNDSGDSKSWLWTLISSLISSDDETVSQAGMSDTLVNFVGINPWISLMSTTFGFIPATIWTTLSACFLVVMGILVVAFVLRIILDLL